MTNNNSFSDEVTKRLNDLADNQITYEPIPLVGSDIALNVDLTLINRLERAHSEEPLKKLWGDYIHIPELCILAGDTGTGKSTLAFETANLITKGGTLLN